MTKQSEFNQEKVMRAIEDYEKTKKTMAKNRRISLLPMIKHEKSVLGDSFSIIMKKDIDESNVK